MQQLFAELFAKLPRMTEFGILASYGAAANYVYAMLKNESAKFSLFKFLALLFLATFLGNLFGGLIPSSSFRDEILMGVGFCTFPLLAALEKHFQKIAIRYLGKVE